MATRGGRTETSWKPGQSGNPKGRPLGARALTIRLREALEENDGRMVRWIIARLLLQSAQGAVDATKLIFDRAEGKVAQPIIGDEEAPVPVTLQFGKAKAKTPKEMTDEELAAAQEQLGDDSDSD